MLRLPISNYLFFVLGGADINGMYVNEKLNNPFELALPLYLRSANQGSIDARVRVGDLYYYGFKNKSDSSKEEKRLDSKEKVTLSSVVENFLGTLPLRVAHVMLGYKTEPNYTMAVAHYSAGN